MSSEFWITLGFSALTWAVLWAIGRFVLPRFNVAATPVEARIVELERRLKESEIASADCKKTQTLLLKELQEYSVKIVRQEEQIRVLRNELESNDVIKKSPVPETLSIVAIWPDGDRLDPRANKQSLEQSGLTHRALLGEQATMSEVMWTLPRVEANALTVGGKGDTEGILLKDGLATNQWWARLAARFNIRYVLLLSDHSEGTRQNSIADAVFAVTNVRAVVSVNGEILDAVAREFERMFYARVQSGSPLSEAFSDAQMAVWAFKDLFVLREKKSAS